MRILLTGGTGDLGSLLAPLLAARGDQPVTLDIQPPHTDTAVHFTGSILNRNHLADAMAGADCVVHIAAWHGIHEVRGEKDVYDFWELNVTGTFLTLETAVQAHVPHFITISSTSVDEWPAIYGSSKLLGEVLTRTYAARHGLNALILRPRAFIPHWNKAVYANYIEWARWFWRGAVHIQDVVQAVLQSIDLLAQTRLAEPLTLVVDGAYEFSDAELANWDANGPGSSFAARYPAYVSLAQQLGLDTAVCPRKLDIQQTSQWLGYTPQFSLQTLLDELAHYGPDGPPAPYPSI